MNRKRSMRILAVLGVGLGGIALELSRAPQQDSLVSQLRQAEFAEPNDVDQIELPAGRPVALVPWREHVTLDLGTAGKLVTEVVVERAAGH